MSEVGAIENIKTAEEIEDPPAFIVGPAVRSEQLEAAHKELLPGTRYMQLAADVMRHAGERGQEASAKAYEMLTYVSDFAEGEMTRASQGVLLEAAQSRWENGRAGYDLRTIVDKLYAFAGVCLPEHTVRDDIATQHEPTGSVVKAGVIAGHAFYFIERVVPTGVGRNVVRRLEAISATHPGCVAALNEYSYVERVAAGRVLDGAGATPAEKEAVLTIANRAMTQTTEQLLWLLGAERGVEQKPRGWFARLAAISPIKA